jgi:hypothetical protein
MVAGILQAGDELYYRRLTGERAMHVVGKVTKDGQINVTQTAAGNDKYGTFSGIAGIYPTPTTAMKMGGGIGTGDGWLRWRSRRRGGRTLAELRDQYLKYGR